MFLLKEQASSGPQNPGELMALAKQAGIMAAYFVALRLACNFNWQ